MACSERGSGAILSIWLRGGGGEEEGGPSHKGDRVTDLQRSTEEKLLTSKRFAVRPAAPSPRKGNFSSLGPVLPGPPRRRWLAPGPSADTKTAAPSARGNQLVSLGPGQGPSPSFGATSGDKGICAVPANTRGEVTRNLLQGLQGSALTLWPQMTTYHSSGQSGQGEDPEAGLPATGAARLFLSQTAAGGRPGRKARSRDELLTSLPLLEALQGPEPAVPRMKGRGSPEPQAPAPSCPPRVSPARWQLDACREGQGEGDRQGAQEAEGFYVCPGPLLPTL